MENAIYKGKGIFGFKSSFYGLQRVLAKNYISVVEVDLCTNNATILMKHTNRKQK